MTDFTKGIIAGAAASVIVFGIIFAIGFFNRRDKELMEYVETQNEIQQLREDYGNRDPYEFLDEVPGVRGAADNAADDFRRKRDEAVQRIRGRYAD
ncbi:hypothetical protein AGMMS50293_28200 [Spirochaetia bacterium]|nr:hypothetical protein AGMMS50293_28200 [Spirochaetia bacterium]